MTDSRFRLVNRLTGAAVFIIALALYIITAEPTVSYWDCPEYVTTATRLEPGHPPGNPMWTLTARIFTLFAPSAAQQALAVNIMSGVCSAVAVLLLYLTLTILIPKLLSPSGNRPAVVCGGAAVGAIALAVSDTFWFSAVEAEVYAMSAMLTALVLWLTFVWGERRGSPGASRYLILVAYITGLAIGVHQLNLLVLPCLALIVLFYRHRDIPKGVFAAAIAGSVLIIAAVLFGMMPGVLAGAGALELLMVNTFGLPLHSGVITYVGVTLAVLIAAVAVTSAGRHPVVCALCAALALWLSGLFSFGGNIWVGGVLSAVVAAGWMLGRRHIPASALNLAMWSVAFLFVGYCSYAMILLRGAANPPMNQGAPSDIFALTSYLNREQYGAAPLLYGRTPYSRPLWREDMHPDGTASYTSYYRRQGHPTYSAVTDSAGTVRYAVASTNDEFTYTPELNMWFPRIHSSDPADIESYRGWTGMDSASMVEVEVSEAVDSTGHPVARLVDGKRQPGKALRPSYMQNLMMLGGYQVSYMYMRYLLWNFAGRQNDVYAQGEADAGNFLTGVAPLDNMMLERPDLMPDDIGDGNPGHHNYWMLPLLLGVVGIAFQLCAGRTGRRQFAVIALLFVLTGLAIVVYLNQTPGQPRERDYSFVGSFYAFCIWIGLGAASLFADAVRYWHLHQRRWWHRPAAVVMTLFCIGVPVLMGVENFPDHNRAHRTATRDFALNVMLPLERDAVLFVNGDNFTFPLWYLRESEGIRQDVTVVNLAYLGTTWYVPQLAQASPGARPLRLSIPSARLNRVDLQRFGVVDIGYGTADAATALGQLFTSSPETPGKRPRIDASHLRFPLPGSTDSVTVDLRAMSGGSGYLRLGSLVALDIMANNPDRPIYWNDAVRGSLPLTLPVEGLNRRFAAARPDSLTRNARIILNHFGGGGLAEGAYIDPPGRQQTYIMRRLIAVTALGLADRGTGRDCALADSLATFSLTRYPAAAVPYTTLTYGGEQYSEALDLAEVYRRLWERTGRDTYRRRALTLARDEQRRTAAYGRYLDALSPRYRTYTKGSTRLSARADSLADAMVRSLMR